MAPLKPQPWEGSTHVPLASCTTARPAPSMPIESLRHQQFQSPTYQRGGGMRRRMASVPLHQRESLLQHEH